MRLSVLALEGLFDTGLTVVLDAFSLANAIFRYDKAAASHRLMSVVRRTEKSLDPREG